MNREQAKKFFEDHKIRYVLAQFVDIHGAAKAKAVPVEHLDMVLTDGAGFAGFALWGFGMGPEGPDYMAVGDLSTLQDIPWMPGYARIICNGVVNEKSYPYCSRVALQAQIARLDGARAHAVHRHRARVHAAARGARTEAWGRPIPPTISTSPATTTRACTARARCSMKWWPALRAVGIDVYQIDHEDGNGQFEINFTYADALKSADNFTFVKMAASEIAHKHGMIATFMPKPFSNRTGSGAHFHVSIGIGDAEERLPRPERQVGHGPVDAWPIISWAACSQHARALCAVAAPTVNSYKRLVVGRALSGATWAPAYIAYGDNNRTACVRVPHGRLEIRLPDSGCNPYLVSAALIAAGLDGIDRKLDPGPPQNINLYELVARGTGRQGHQAVAAVARTRRIDALEADAVICDGSRGRSSRANSSA